MRLDEETHHTAYLSMHVKPSVATFALILRQLFVGCKERCHSANISGKRKRATSIDRW